MRVWPDDAGFCPADGMQLKPADLVPVARTNDPLLGTLLCGRYELRRMVAAGGMGRVYESIDQQINARVAVKVLHEEVAQNPLQLERFKREYEISSQLPHEFIVKVFDFQHDPALGAWLLVMEFLDGEELRGVLKRDHQVSPERLVRMISQIAMGLEGAHAKKFVHRDLKPDNLFLCGTREGDDVKILDFGSVKNKNDTAKKLTTLGTQIGSPFYMAPEQAQGLDTVDARADVFALAAITYECVTGEVPFAGTSGPSILFALLSTNPDPPSSKNEQVKYPIPRALDPLMDVALAKDPDLRTKSVGDFASALGHAYGLTGNPMTWAHLAQGDLARQIAEASARVAATDRFVAPRSSADQQPAPLTAPNVHPANHAGVPARRPVRLVLAVAGILLALVVGIIAVIVLRHR